VIAITFWSFFCALLRGLRLRQRAHNKLFADAICYAHTHTHSWDTNGNVGRAPIKGFGDASADKE
jgi:hypothetical protein